MIALNGFDEWYGENSISDDTDLNWRFRAFGLQIKSCKNVANQFHLWHRFNYREAGSECWEKMQENKSANRFVCSLGIHQHEI